MVRTEANWELLGSVGQLSSGLTGGLRGAWTCTCLKEVQNLDFYVKFSNLKNTVPTNIPRAVGNTFLVYDLCFKDSDAIANEDVAAKLFPAYFSVPNIWSLLFPAIPTAYTLTGLVSIF